MLKWKLIWAFVSTWCITPEVLHAKWWKMSTYFFETYIYIYLYMQLGSLMNAAMSCHLHKRNFFHNSWERTGCGHLEWIQMIFSSSQEKEIYFMSSCSLRIHYTPNEEVFTVKIHNVCSVSSGAFDLGGANPAWWMTFEVAFVESIVKNSVCV